MYVWIFFWHVYYCGHRLLAWLLYWLGSEHGPQVSGDTGSRASPWKHHAPFERYATCTGCLYGVQPASIHSLKLLFTNWNWEIHTTLLYFAGCVWRIYFSVNCGYFCTFFWRIFFYWIWWRSCSRILMNVWLFKLAFCTNFLIHFFE